MGEPSAGDAALLRDLRHPQLRWNAPLSATRADRLLSALRLRPGGQLLDLGCGWGGLLLRGLAVAPGTRGVGVERELRHVRRARRDARASALADRVRFVVGDVLQYDGTGDAVLCIGADHAWGGAGPALAQLPRSLAGGGTLLFGTGYWSQPPSSDLLEMFGTLPLTPDGLGTLARTAGWSVVSCEVASLQEWDAFEETWTQALDEIAAREPNTSAGAAASRLALQRRAEYREGYRGVLGFAYLLLRRRDG